MRLEPKEVQSKGATVMRLNEEPYIDYTNYQGDTSDSLFDS